MFKNKVLYAVWCMLLFLALHFQSIFSKFKNNAAHCGHTNIRPINNTNNKPLFLLPSFLKNCTLGLVPFLIKTSLPNIKLIFCLLVQVSDQDLDEVRHLYNLGSQEPLCSAHQQLTVSLPPDAEREQAVAMALPMVRSCFDKH
jgi:hypothetical protein